MNSDRVIASGLAKDRFCRWQSRSPEGLDAPPGRGVRYESLVCPGGSPYCWYSVFEVQEGEIVLSPHYPSRIIWGVNTLKAKISQNFFSNLEEFDLGA